tara:strand:+ start:4352 stop:4948 length:597 start_codon:yes stop_codon:yes gene_type:complete
MVMDRPFSQACDNNKASILIILQKHVADVDFVLEVGSGTGQHAVHFARHLSHLTWQPTDRPEYIDGINLWRNSEPMDNLLSPLQLDVNQPWPIDSVPAVFSANTLHIMSWLEVEKFFRGVKEVLKSGGVLCVYGPFNYQEQYTSDSNRQFDQQLKARNPLSGIRDFEAINRLAISAGLTLMTDYPMPSNNRCLVWTKD